MDVMFCFNFCIFPTVKDDVNDIKQNEDRTYYDNSLTNL
jgi:hypothetical protein